MAGADYPISIHASELVTLASANSVKINVTSSKASSSGGGGGGGGGLNSNLQTILLITVAAFAVVMFLLVLRKPRTVMVDAMSRLVHHKQAGGGQAVHRGSPPARPPTPATPNARNSMRLRGRDMQGLSYDLAFTDADFRRCGGRLVIGRNNDLSQLLLSHDSVSRQHTTLILQGNTVQVEDRNSGNGTKVNGCDLIVGTPAIPLRNGDKLTLGEVDLMFEILN